MSRRGMSTRGRDEDSTATAGGWSVEGATGTRGGRAPPAPSPRLLSAESRLAQEKAWLVDVPEYCSAEATRGSDFVWSFRVSGLHGTLYQEVGKVCFRAHFPRDYPRTPPTLLLTDELVHPNWKFPARGLEIPDLTKEGWNPSMTIPKMLLHLREIIQRPDVSALGLMWKEGSGPLVDGGASLGVAGNVDGLRSPVGCSIPEEPRVASLLRAATAPPGEVSPASGVAGDAPAPERSPLAAAAAAGARAGMLASSAMTTASGWTAARRGIDRDLALLYLLDAGAFRALVLRHQQHLASSALPPTGLKASAANATSTAAGVAGVGPGAGAGRGGGYSANGGGAGGNEGGPAGAGKPHPSRRMKPGGALHGLGSFARKVAGGGSRGGHARRSHAGGDSGGGGGVGGGPAEGGANGDGRWSKRALSTRGLSTRGYGELSEGKMAELRQQNAAAEEPSLHPFMATSPNVGSRRSMLRRAESWGEEVVDQDQDDGIPAAVDGKARKVLGLPQRKSSISGASSTFDRAAFSQRSSSHRHAPLRPSQAPLPQQQQQQDGQLATDLRSDWCAGSASPFPLVPPAPPADGAHPTMAPLSPAISSATSGDEADFRRVLVERSRRRDLSSRGRHIAADAGAGLGTRGPRGCRYISKSLPPREGQERAAAQAAQLEADKVATLRHFAAEARLETEADALERRAESVAAGSMTVDELDPPVLPSGEVLDEGSKAWKVLGAGGTPPRRRVPQGRSPSFPSRALASGTSSLMNGTNDEQQRQQQHRRRRRHKQEPRQGRFSLSFFPSGGSRSAVTDADDDDDDEEEGGIAGPISLSLVGLDMSTSAGAGELANLGAIAAPPRMPDVPPSPGVQTPPPQAVGAAVITPPAQSITMGLSLGVQTPPPDSARLTVDAQACDTPTILLDSRPRSQSMWANRTVEEAQEGAAAVSPPHWGLAAKDSDAAGGGGRSRTPSGQSRSAASTPRGHLGRSMWGGGIGDGGGSGIGGRSGGGSGSRREDHRGGLASKTPGRLPRRLHKGVNKVKRAVGVGESTPSRGQIGPAGGSGSGVAPRTPRQNASESNNGRVTSYFSPSPARSLPGRSWGDNDLSHDNASGVTLRGGRSGGGGGGGSRRARSPRVGAARFAARAAGSPDAAEASGGKQVLPPRSGKPSSAPAAAAAATASAALAAMTVEQSPEDISGSGTGEGGEAGNGNSSSSSTSSGSSSRSSSGGRNEARGTGRSGKQRSQQQSRRNRGNQHQQQQQYASQERRDKLAKLVKVLGPESRDDILEAINQSGAAAAYIDGSTAPTSVANSLVNSPSVNVNGGSRSRRSLSAPLSGVDAVVPVTTAGDPSPGGLGERSLDTPSAMVGVTGAGAGLSGGSAKSGKGSKFAFKRRLREGLDIAYQNRGMLFCLQEAILYARGKDPICPGHRPRWWPDDPATSPQIRAPLTGAWFEGLRVGAASLLPWQIRLNLFSGDGAGDGGRNEEGRSRDRGGRAGEGRIGMGCADDSRIRADGTRLPPMMVVPLEATRRRLPSFEEGAAVPVSSLSPGATVVWVSHCWMGTPPRPDDQANGKAKAIYEGLKGLDKKEVYIWIDASCLPSTVEPADGQEVFSAAAKGQAVAEAVAAANAEVVQTEAQVKEDLGRRARTIRALLLYLLCCDCFLAVDEREQAYLTSPWTRLERAAVREAITLTSGGGSTKASRDGHPRMLSMQRDEVGSFMGLNKRPTSRLFHLSNLSVLPKLELLPPFGQGSKAGASGIWAADVPAIKRSFELLKGLSQMRQKLARYPCMDIPRLEPSQEEQDQPLRLARATSPGNAAPGRGTSGSLRHIEPERRPANGLCGAERTTRSSASVEPVRLAPRSDTSEERGGNGGIGLALLSPPSPEEARRPFTMADVESVRDTDETTSGMVIPGGQAEEEVHDTARGVGAVADVLADPITSAAAERTVAAERGGSSGHFSAAAPIAADEASLRPQGLHEQGALDLNTCGKWLSVEGPSETVTALTVDRMTQGPACPSGNATADVYPVSDKIAPADTAAASGSGREVSARERFIHAMVVTPARQRVRDRLVANNCHGRTPVSGMWGFPPPGVHVPVEWTTRRQAVADHGGAGAGARADDAAPPLQAAVKEDAAREGDSVGGDGAVVLVHDESAIGLGWDENASGVELELASTSPPMASLSREHTHVEGATGAAAAAAVAAVPGETSADEAAAESPDRSWIHGKPPPISRLSSSHSKSPAPSTSPPGEGGSGGGGHSGGGFSGSGGGGRVTARPPPSPAGGSAQGGGAPHRRSAWSDGAEGGDGSGGAEASDAAGATAAHAPAYVKPDERISSWCAPGANGDADGRGTALDLQAGQAGRSVTQDRRADAPAHGGFRHTREPSPLSRRFR